MMFVEPGSTVAEFDKICEVQSDKASVEITSRFAGKVKTLHHKVNEVAKVGYPLVDIETDDDGDDDDDDDDIMLSAEKPLNTVPEELATKKKAPVIKDPSLLTFMTPAVRRILAENGLDISVVKGSGKGGRVLKEDVLAYLSGKPPQPDQSEEDKPALVSDTVSIPMPRPDDHIENLSGIQKAMFKSMTGSLSIPQLGYKDEIELDEATKYRAALNRHISSHSSLYAFQKMTYLPIFVKCLSIALSHYPIMNASISGDENDLNSIRVNYRNSHNVGIAMATPQGLMVPNIKDVQSKTIFEIAAEIHRLTELGKRNGISPADLKGGTITLSNIGTIGGTYANPVIVSSELAIVALGKMQNLPRFNEEGKLVSKQILPISWSADHRVIDGATVARFGNHWKILLENPALLASELR
ncbi:hypothetical protein DFQ29_004495 [Apophysomyces sp. BC1021]|nr:hypothetical protein DFQ29_004495 [Apophysomyces sp. BC1021]